MSEKPLSPSFEVVASLFETIQNEIAKKGDPVELATLVSSLLQPIGLWSNQIPQMLSGTPSSKCANLIFAIRKELFPTKDTNIFGKALADLPQTVQDFDLFVHKLMDVQEKSKKPLPRVHLRSSCLQHPRGNKSQSNIDDDDLEIINAPVSEPAPETSVREANDTVMFAFSSLKTK
jgi:hypothetical protein